MHFLGTNLLIDSPTNGIIDIHGMGRIGRKDEKLLRKVLWIVYFHLNDHLDWQKIMYLEDIFGR